MCPTSRAVEEIRSTTARRKRISVLSLHLMHLRDTDDHEFGGVDVLGMDEMSQMNDRQNRSRFDTVLTAFIEREESIPLAFGFLHVIRADGGAAATAHSFSKQLVVVDEI